MTGNEDREGEIGMGMRMKVQRSEIEWTKRG